MFGEVDFLVLFCATVLSAKLVSIYGKDGPLILTPYIENGETAKAKELSAVEPSLFAGVNSHAAYVTVDKVRKWNLFFWYFPAQGVDLERTPLVIWLQGGPGGSSLYGLFNEIGPIRIINITAERMPITWGSSYSLLFIDNPVGTGFSFTDGGEYATNEDEIGACLLNFIQQLILVFPEFTKAPLFIAGESYAGKYIPAFGHYIHNNLNNSLPINLRGLIIGAGWTDPPTLLHYAEWGLQVGLLDPEQAEVIHKMEEEARRHWDEDNYDEYDKIARKSYNTFLSYAPVNEYNYLREFKVKYGLSYESFLNKPDVQSALHVKKKRYNAMSWDVSSHLNHEKYDSVKHWLEELLEHYGVMCYNGQLDFDVAYALSVHTYRSLNWSGAQAYRDAPRTLLRDPEDNTLHAFVKASGNFMEVMVRGAGHMTSADKPRAVKQMIDLFINKFK